MPVRRVVLTDQQEALVSTLVSSGRYRDADEVLLDGLGMIERREAWRVDKCGASRPVGNAAHVGPDCWITQLRLPSGTA